MGTPESTREPCADRIVDDTGGAFGMGITVGSAFHFIKGMYNSPTGARLSGGLENVRMNAPKVGGSFAVWGGLLSSFDCAIGYARQKDDDGNSVLAGAATGGLLSLRRGFRASRDGALFGGALLTLIAGTFTAVSKYASAEQNEEAFMGDAASLPPAVHMCQVLGQSVTETSSASEAGLSCWFGGLFGSGKKEEAEDKSESTTQILESF